MVDAIKHLFIVHVLVTSISGYYSFLPNETSLAVQTVSKEYSADANSEISKAELYENEITAFTTDYKIVCLLDTRVCEKVTYITAYRGKEVLYVEKVIEPAGLITDHLFDYKIAVKR